MHFGAEDEHDARRPACARCARAIAQGLLSLQRAQAHETAEKVNELKSAATKIGVYVQAEESIQPTHGLLKATHDTLSHQGKTMKKNFLVSFFSALPDLQKKNASIECLQPLTFCIRLDEKR
jgi:hypothetical protein